MRRVGAEILQLDGASRRAGERMCAYAAPGLDAAAAHVREDARGVAQVLQLGAREHRRASLSHLLASSGTPRKRSPMARISSRTRAITKRRSAPARE